MLFDLKLITEKNRTINRGKGKGVWNLCLLITQTIESTLSMHTKFYVYKLRKLIVY